MKNKLRKEALEKRRSLDCVKLSEEIIKNLISTKEYKVSKNIINYYPLKYETDTKVLFNDKTKKWYLPRVKGEFLEICPFGKIGKGSFGIQEPKTEAINDYTKINMIIIPACAADRCGYRIGWGKGYYDRFLPLLPKECLKVVLVYSSLIYESIFPSKYDINADMIVTDKEILII